MINEGMHKVTHTWSSSDGKSWKYRGEHDSADDAADVAMTRVGKESGYHAIGTKKKALYYVDHKGRTYGINEAAIEPPHERKFMGKKKTPVDVKPELKSSAEQHVNKSMNVRESARSLDTPKKMKYIGPSDSVLTQGQTVHALTGKMISGGVRVDTGKHRVVVHHRDLVDEEVQIDELSYKTLTSYAAKARSNIAHRKYLKYGEPDKSAEHDNKIAKHEEGIKVAKEKTKPPVFGKANVKVKHSEAEAADRKIADIDAKLSKTVRPSSNAIKDALGKMPAAAQKIADLRNKKAKMSEENITEISKEELRAMAVAAAQKVQVTKVPAGASSDISSYKWKKAMQNGGKVAATKAVMHDPEEFSPSATFKGTNAHRKHVREETVTETNRPSHHNPTVLVTFKGNKGAGGVKRIPKSEYDPKLHSLVEWVSKEQLAANRKARVDKFIENGAKVKKIMDDEHKKNNVKTNTKEEVESIDELSRKTLNRYVDKAIDDHGHKNFISRNIGGKENKKFFSDLAKKRAKGISRADDKLYGNAKVNASEEHQFLADLHLAIESNGAHPVTFADGKRAAISPGYADLILAKYESISEESKRDEFVSTISSNLKTLRESIKR